MASIAQRKDIASPAAVNAGIAAGNSADAASTPLQRALSIRSIWIGVAALIAFTWLVSRSGLYTSGSNVGYYLGVTGGLMMLALLLYPLRKHFKPLQKLGALRYWFQIHMFLGIAGPTLILLHATYRVGSVNAAMAYYSMLIVAGSGIIGRFWYTKIHRGLYGRRESLQDMQTKLGIADGEMKSRFDFAPNVVAKLRTFETQVLEAKSGFARNAWRFFTLGLRARLLYSHCKRDVAGLLKQRALQRGWPREKLARRYFAATAQIKTYLDTLRDVAQFDTYERLFSWWHVLHVPLVYLLAISAIVHVIAVHMY